MNFGEQQQQPMTSKPKTTDKIQQGKEQIENAVKKAGENEQVRAVGAAVNDAKNKFLGMLTGRKSEQQPQLQTRQNLMGGKRRRKSRRKKRTKRRRKSRRKKRRTKRRRKSRRKRRR